MNEIRIYVLKKFWCYRACKSVDCHEIFNLCPKSISSSYIMAIIQPLLMKWALTFAMTTIHRFHNKEFNGRRLSSIKDLRDIKRVISVGKVILFFGCFRARFTRTFQASWGQDVVTALCKTFLLLPILSIWAFWSFLCQTFSSSAQNFSNRSQCFEVLPFHVEPIDSSTIWRL